MVPRRGVVPFWHLAGGAVVGFSGWAVQDARPLFRLSKICDYLADKFCALMLSEVVAGFKNKVDGSRSRFPIWESQRISAP